MSSGLSFLPEEYTPDGMPELLEWDVYCLVPVVAEHSRALTCRLCSLTLEEAWETVDHLTICNDCRLVLAHHFGCPVNEPSPAE